MATLDPTRFRSLRIRLLGPLVLAAFCAAGIVAGVSYWLGSRWATNELQKRFVGIEQTLAESTFPINASVLDSLANLTQTELVTLDSLETVIYSTVKPIPKDGLVGQVVIDDNRYIAMNFKTIRPGARFDGVFEIAVLFDQKQIDDSRRRAALLPLATGLSTIVALSTVTLLLGSRLVSRLGRLQRRVEAIAGGDFASSASDNVTDEVGRLGESVDEMAAQLDQLWNQVNRQQGEKLLHQIAGGMAHQLRNSLTGARMAVELHGAGCEQSDDEGLRIAIHQIELSEDYVRRLLLVASGRQDEDRPRTVAECWDDVQTSLSPLAQHLRIAIQWKIDESIADQKFQDGSTWVAAATNLIHNAMEAGDQVKVTLSQVNDRHVRLEVMDNGAGVASSVADELFEPFVTSKPEGMGLGLSVVRRAAEYLGGHATWKSVDGWTVFILDASVA